MHKIIRTVTYRGCVIPEPYDEYDSQTTWAAGFDAGYEAAQLNSDAPAHQDRPTVGPAGYPSVYRDAFGELWRVTP